MQSMITQGDCLLLGRITDSMMNVDVSSFSLRLLLVGVETPCFVRRVIHQEHCFMSHVTIVTTGEFFGVEESNTTQDHC